MSEEIDKHVLKKYEVQQRLGKGVSAGRHFGRLSLLPACRWRRRHGKQRSAGHSPPASIA